MQIKTSEKRKKFERLIWNLGYRDRSPILSNAKKIVHNIFPELSGQSYEIFYFTIPYYNKKTYLYKFFIDNYDKFNKKEMKKELRILTKNILYYEKTRLCEIGWGINNSMNLLFSSKEHLKKIYFRVLKKGKKDFTMGDNILHPIEGDIMVSKPDGRKLLGGDTQRSIRMGTEQRGNINSRLGFGPVKEHGSQYGRYNHELILKPI